MSADENKSGSFPLHAVNCPTCKKEIDKGDRPSIKLYVDLFHCHNCDTMCFLNGDIVPPDFEKRFWAAFTKLMEEYDAEKSKDQ